MTQFKVYLQYLLRTLFSQLFSKQKTPDFSAVLKALHVHISNVRHM